MKIDDLNLSTYLKDAVEKGGTIRISLPDTLFIISVSKQRITTKQYKRGDVSKIWRHTVTSASEMGQAIVEIGYLIASSLGSVGQLAGFFKRDEPLQIKYVREKK